MSCVPLLRLRPGVPPVDARQLLLLLLGLLIIFGPGPASGLASAWIPPLSQLKPDHPRVLLRARPSPWAASQQELRPIPQDQDWARMLAQLREEKSASA